jgi:integrase
MAVYKSKDPHRELPWCADWYEGPRRRKRYFATQEEAENCEETHKASVRNRGLPLTMSALERVYVREIVERYRDEVTPNKAGSVFETSRLNRFLTQKPGKDLCAKSCAYLTKQDGYDYVKARLKQRGKKGDPITARTVSRERNLLQDVFVVAEEQLGYTNLFNPFRGLKIKGSKYQRRRLIEEGELERLRSASQHCHGLNQLFVPLAVYLAIETGMREQELFNLVWKDIDFNKRLIKIRKSKTDHLQASPGRIIPLTWGALFWFGVLRTSMEHHGVSFNKSNRIFPMTQGAFMQTWNGVVKRAGIEDLQFRDLRHEAGTRWDEADLSKPQIATLLGHSSADTTDIYINSRLRLIREKLDRYMTRDMGGLTLEEYYKPELDRELTVFDLFTKLDWIQAEFIHVGREAENEQLRNREYEMIRRVRRHLFPEERQALLDEIRRESKSDDDREEASSSQAQTSNVVKFKRKGA